MMDGMSDKFSREQIELLIALQEKERAAVKVQAVLDELPARMEEVESGLKQMEAAINEKKEHLAELKKVYRAHDADIQTNQGRIQKREEQLRSVKTNKEYQAILKEIAEIKKASSRMEDETLACLDQMDAVEKEIREQEEALAAEAEEVARQKSMIEADAETERRSLEELVGEQTAIAQQIDPQLIDRYEMIKSHSRGIAIVQVKESVCLGCHMNIPPQMYNELHRENEIKTCPHCHRLLYVIL